MISTVESALQRLAEHGTGLLLERIRESLISGEGRKLDMRCRVPGCKYRSRGPRYRYMCSLHGFLPVTHQLAYLRKAKMETPR